MGNQFRRYVKGRELNLIIELPWIKTDGGFNTTDFAVGFESILKNIERKIKLFGKLSSIYELDLNTNFFNMEQVGYKSKIITSDNILRLSIKFYLNGDINRDLFICNKCMIDTPDIKTREFNCSVVDKLDGSSDDFYYRVFSKLKKI